MPTTIDQFIAAYQFCQQLADMQKNILVSLQVIQTGMAKGTLLVTPQQAVQSLGFALQARLNTLKSLQSAQPVALSSGLTQIGVLAADVTTIVNDLTAVIASLATNAVVSATDMSSLIATVSSTVPVAIQPY